VKTPEGLVLPGYLTLPVGVEPKNLPAIVLPHGGPYSRDSWGYDPLVQLLASRGYAVIQVNFRGSTGYGKAWKEAGFQGWGTVMHEDITSAARWLIAQGVADPKRLCIVGWSYGGYAALLGAIKEPGLYRCAASIAGVTSLGQLQRDREIYYGGSDATRNQTGTEDLAESSPVRLVDRMQVPVLLVHGTDDMQVRVDHSKRMAKALEQARKPAELVLIEDGDHSLSRAAWRETLYARLTRFLEANLGP
jgi:dipeptidyl aminopeptidase/acylaminoacyl peptidase